MGVRGGWLMEQVPVAVLYSQQNERQALGVDSPDGDTCSVTLVRGWR